MFFENIGAAALVSHLFPRYMLYRPEEVGTLRKIRKVIPAILHSRPFWTVFHQKDNHDVYSAGNLDTLTVSNTGRTQIDNY